MNFNVNDIRVDFKSTFGNEYLLVDVVSKPVYKDGIRTEDVVYSYVVCCYDRKMKQISVKIPGKQLIATPENGPVAVELVEPEARPYVMNGQLGFSISATSIKEIK